MAKSKKKAVASKTTVEVQEVAVVPVKKYRRGEHPNSKKNIDDGRKSFSAEYQPPIYRQKTTILTDLLIEELGKSQTVVVYGKDIVTGKITPVLVEQPTKEVIIRKLASEAAKGNMKAIEIVLDRVDGKVPIPIVPELPPEDMPERVVILPDGTKIPL